MFINENKVKNEKIDKMQIEEGKKEPGLLENRILSLLETRKWKVYFSFFLFCLMPIFYFKCIGSLERSILKDEMQKKNSHEPGGKKRGKGKK